MSNQDEEHNMGSTLWQSQALESPRISLEYVRHQAEKLNTDFRKENYGIYAALLVATAFFVWMCFDFPPATYHSIAWVMRLGMFLILPAAAYILVQMRRSGSIVVITESEKVSSSLYAYRDELQRRRDLYFRMRYRSLWPTVPAVLVIFVGGVIYDQRPGKLFRYTMVVLLVLIGGLFNVWYYRRKGLKFQRELNALATLDTK